jgi:hypothetical protein
MKTLRLWKDEKGSLDFVQIVIAILMIAIAAVSTTYSIYVGRATLTEQLQEKQALRYAREEMEYWAGQVLSGEVTAFEVGGSGNLGTRVLIDARDPEDMSDNVWGRVCYGRLEPVFSELVGETSSIDFYRIHVWVIWPENLPERERHRIDLYTSMFPSLGQ